MAAPTAHRALAGHDSTGVHVSQPSDPQGAPLDAPPHRLAYPPAEVAQLLGLGRSKTLALIADGTIPSVKIDRARRILHADLVAYVESLRRAGDGSMAPGPGGQP
jgi:excisionase family DNA binding protein